MTVGHLFGGLTQGLHREPVVRFVSLACFGREQVAHLVAVGVGAGPAVARVEEHQKIVFSDLIADFLQGTNDVVTAGLFIRQEQHLVESVALEDLRHLDGVVDRAGEGGVGGVAVDANTNRDPAAIGFARGVAVQRGGQ